ncbi:MAG: AMP-binding protein [Salinivirgaceae bacterium]|nr:AMP-binding protein [Salinivirgaceae bacterium]
MEGYNLIKVFEKTIQDHWDLEAFSDYELSTSTYKQVGENILKLHSLFEACNIKKGDKIALIGKNSTQWCITYLATITYGATIVPILADFPQENIQNIINHSDAKLLFADEAIYKKVDTTFFQNLKCIFDLKDFSILYTFFECQFEKDFQTISKDFIKEHGNGILKDNFVLPKIDDKNLGVISYTSGTTGFSKGVMLPLSSLMANIHFAWNNMPLKANDKMLSILPLAHAYGCAFEFLWPFATGVHVTFLGKLVSPKIMIQAFQQIKPRLILMVPLIIEKIYKKQILPILSKPSMQILLRIPIINRVIHKKIYDKLSAVFGGNFREVVIGGAALNGTVEQFLRKIGFNYSVGYGMTECGPLISYANWDKTALGSCGSVVDKLEINIDSPDSENIPGEILVKGTHVMTGYYKNKEETDKVIDENGWLHTGDLGVIDKVGFIHIKGRSKCLILGPSGENIYPEEIESKLSTYPYVSEQLVISDNNKLVALIFPDLEKSEKDGLQIEELVYLLENTKQEVNKTLPKYAQISKIEIQSKQFEKTPKQSIMRFKYETIKKNN